MRRAFIPFIRGDTKVDRQTLQIRQHRFCTEERKEDDVGTSIISKRSEVEGIREFRELNFKDKNLTLDSYSLILNGLGRKSLIFHSVGEVFISCSDLKKLREGE